MTTWNYVRRRESFFQYTWSLTVGQSLCIVNTMKNNKEKVEELQTAEWSFLLLFRSSHVRPLRMAWKCIILFDHRRVCACFLSLSIYSSFSFTLYLFRTVNTINESYLVSATVFRCIERISRYFWEAIKQRRKNKQGHFSFFFCQKQKRTRKKIFSFFKWTFFVLITI